MIKIVGVRFKNAGKIYYFDPVELELEKNMDVVVETARGLEYGTIVVCPKEIDESELVTETASYEYEFGTVHLTVYYAKFLSKNFDLIAHSEVKWIDPAEVSKLTWAPADIPAAKVISKTNLNGMW